MDMYYNDDDASPIHHLTHHQFRKRDMMTIGSKPFFFIVGICIGITVRPASSLPVSGVAAASTTSTAEAAAEQQDIFIIALSSLQLTRSERELSKNRHHRRHESEQHHPSNSKFDGNSNNEKPGGTQQQTPAPTNDLVNEVGSADIDDNETSQSQQHGQLEEQENEQTIIDYSIYACDELPNRQQKAINDGGDSASFSQCEFAMNCNDGDGILFSQFFFCNSDEKSSSATTSSSPSIPASTTSSSTPHSLLITTITLLLLLLALLLLFRLLSSTTDEFFSPGLEMFSLRLGLPPRFAGVTLLALGNGAPDVAATMNAMLAGSRGVGVDVDEGGSGGGGGREGYGMALGELTGTCMFNICLILGAIVIYLGGDSGGARKNKSNEDEVEKKEVAAVAVVRGVPCQGPLLRDISVLILVSVVSMSYLKSGVIDHEFVYVMLGIYVSYVLVVLGADAYHVFYHVPLMADMLRRSSSNGSGFSLDEPTSSGLDKGETGDRSVANEQTPLVALQSHRCEKSHRYLRHRNSSSSSVPPHHHHTIGETVIEAMSNYSCMEESVIANPAINGGRADHLQLVDAAAAFREDEGPPIIQKEASIGWAPSFDDGNEPLVIFHPNHAVHPHHHHLHKPSHGPVLFLRSDSSHGHSPSPRKIAVAVDTAAEATKAIKAPLLSTLAAGVVDIDCFASSSLHSSPPLQIKLIRPNSWKEAWSSNLQEFIEHWHDFFTDIYFNKENSAWDVALLSMELPFTITRKLTNPVPCDGYYCRPLVAVSLSLSPIWIWIYFSDQFDVDIFEYNVGYAVLITAVGMSLVVMRYAPGGEGPMDFYMVIPLTLYGFAVAATWIDSIANKLVEILELFGILLRIPSTILGLTVLAFGNSIQDLVANVTLSKKGLSTMATTACFAGPIFNLCAGLGLGFWALMKSTGREEIHVELPRNIATGFMFAIANCLLIIIAGTVVGKGVIGRGYGYAACGMYTVYVLTSLYI